MSPLLTNLPDPATVGPFYVVFPDGAAEILKGKTIGHAIDKVPSRNMPGFAI
jgi:hypothetical protein